MSCEDSTSGFELNHGCRRWEDYGAGYAGTSPSSGALWYAPRFVTWQYFSIVERFLAGGERSSRAQTLTIFSMSGSGQRDAQVHSQHNPKRKLKFDFTIDDLKTLTDGPTASILSGLGGIQGLLNGLRTDVKEGLHEEEDILDGIHWSDTGHGFNGCRASLGGLSKHEHKESRGFSDRRRAFGENRTPDFGQASQWSHLKSFAKLFWLAFNDGIIWLLTASTLVNLVVGVIQLFVSNNKNATNTETIEERNSTSNHAPAYSETKMDWVQGAVVLIAILILVLLQASMDMWRKITFEKLLMKSERKVWATRSSKRVEIKTTDILVGDIIVLHAGDAIPADGLLIEGTGIKCNESAMSGESRLVTKTPVDDSEEEPYDPTISSGTQVAQGSGVYLVTAVGLNSKYGAIQQSLEEDSKSTPLQRKLSRLAKNILIVSLLAGLLYSSLS